jgi:hypothetical protein
MNSSSLKYMKTAAATVLAVWMLLGLFCASAYSAEATLAWDPNGEADLLGYGLYFRKGAPGPPYNLAGYVTEAELDDPDNPTFTVSGLDTVSRYFFAITAYDTSNLESGFSSALCVDIGAVNSICSNSLPVVVTAGSSGGAGGGGCFIEAALGR